MDPTMSSGRCGTRVSLLIAKSCPDWMWKVSCDMVIEVGFCPFPFYFCEMGSRVI